MDYFFTNMKIEIFFAAISKKVEEVIKGDNLVLSLNHIKPKKRTRGIPESLFAVEFPNYDHKFSILLDRRHKRGM